MFSDSPFNNDAWLKLISPFKNEDEEFWSRMNAPSMVTVNLIDAQEGVTDQDLHLIEFTLNAGRALVVGINKLYGLL